MNRTLRRALVVVVVVCSVLIAALAAAAPRAPRLPQRALQPASSAAEEGPAPRRDGPGPRLVPEQGVHDFGTVMQGDKVRHVFVLRNEGTETAHLGAVKTSCGCTASVLSQKEIPPGERGEVQVEFKAGSSKGRFRKTIRVSSDDPSSPLTLAIEGRTQPLVGVEPELVLFGRVGPGEEVRRRVTVKAHKPGLALDPKARPTSLAIRLEAVRQVSPQEWTVDLVAHPEKLGDNLNGVLMLASGHEASPWIRIRTAGQAEGP